ncbi:MAG: amidohydrolase [Gammaproteobacteria bacterium]|nr:amidohydrolase [Gammaproteobacteria bacterium]
MNVTIVQADLHWHDPAANRALFEAQIDALRQPTDLIVLPEMFATGFTMDAVTYAESMDGASMRWLATMAARSRSAICGSLIIKERDRYYNRFVYMQADGAFTCYDKRHLFRLADEQQHYTAGSDRVVFEHNGFRICPMVCYDLRFPVWSRSKGDYDLLIYVANWPSRRHHAWTTLLMARAIENQCYVVGVNRTGTDGNDLPYSGGSAIIDYLGHEIVTLQDRIACASADIDLAGLARFRERFPFHVDADSFELG